MCVWVCALYFLYFRFKNEFLKQSTKPKNRQHIHDTLVYLTPLSTFIATALMPPASRRGNNEARAECHCPPHQRPNYTQHRPWLLLQPGLALLYNLGRCRFSSNAPPHVTWPAPAQIGPLVCPPGMRGWLAFTGATWESRCCCSESAAAPPLLNQPTSIWRIGLRIDLWDYGSEDEGRACPNSVFVHGCSRWDVTH